MKKGVCRTAPATPGLVPLSLRSRDKDATSSTGCIYSVLVSHVVDTVPAFAWVRQVLLHIEVNSHQVVCKRGPIQYHCIGG